MMSLIPGGAPCAAPLLARAHPPGGGLTCRRALDPAATLLEVKSRWHGRAEGPLAHLHCLAVPLRGCLYYSTKHQQLATGNATASEGSSRRGRLHSAC